MDVSYDINELLTNGFFKTVAGRTINKILYPMNHSSQKAPVNQRLNSTRTTTSLPIIENETESLSRESCPSIPSYDPPFKGTIDQEPIMLEVKNSNTEAPNQQNKVSPLENEIQKRKVALENAENKEQGRRKKKLDRILSPIGPEKPPKINLLAENTVKPHEASKKYRQIQVTPRDDIYQPQRLETRREEENREMLLKNPTIRKQRDSPHFGYNRSTPNFLYEGGNDYYRNQPHNGPIIHPETRYDVPWDSDSTRTSDRSIDDSVTGHSIDLTYDSSQTGTSPIMTNQRMKSSDRLYSKYDRGYDISPSYSPRIPSPRNSEISNELSLRRKTSPEGYSSPAHSDLLSPPTHYPETNDLYGNRGCYPLKILKPLPSCPRKNFIKGQKDWQTLPHCHNFDICGFCFEASISTTEFSQFFVPSPCTTPETEILCDFGSSPWYRIAWLIIVTRNLKTLNFFYELAHVASKVPPCRGEQENTRNCCSILDPWTGELIHDFNICFNCVNNIEVLLPALRGIFVYSDLRDPRPCSCDLRASRSDFVQYFDTLEIMAEKANYEGFPADTRPLARLIYEIKDIS
ncbi:hypothetical protein GcC1_106005 [Golovinomyces cichoracearum]|uniref:Uncharacterized protein n=1 Tax=Golovinomyces cichoracearum TaxID=62708 RepID=A0A420I9E5_9PEZI|nr:hypothetical protein GcC1_106005 [Golovinomyces cichoracearum]